MIHDAEFLEVYGDLFAAKSSSDVDRESAGVISKDKIVRPVYLVLSRDNGNLEVKSKFY
jgi:hypothetical protein